MVSLKRTTIPPILFGLLLAAVPGTGAAGEAPPEEEAGPAASRNLAPEAVAEGPEDLTGRWYSDFGYLELRQTGLQVEGTYSCCEGTLQGTLKGPQLEFEWQDPIYGEGWGVLLWKPDEPDRLSGGWGKSDDMGYAGRWFAARVPDWSFEGRPTTWLVESEHETFGPLRATARLYRSGDAVEGYLEGVYPTEARGEPFRMEVLYRLSGRWEGDRLTLSWQDLARQDEEGSIELQPLGEGDGILTGRWEGHLSASPQRVRLVPAARP
ncbi:MAG: hypothetical protein ACLF0P_06310 [Thermoanaerobaculia bacterium]